MRDWLTHLPWITRRSWRSSLPIYAGLDFFPSARFTTAPRVIVNHSTETLGLPSYNNGAAAPHFTGDLVTGQVWQHVPLSWGSRCLAVSTGGHRDLTVNTSGTVQIEWIGAVTPGYPAKYGHYDIPRRFPTDTRAQGFVARLWRAIADETDIPLEMSGYATWAAYPASYGVNARQRLTSFQFRDARGLLGHQHAPANDHGDGLLGRAVNGSAVDMEKALVLARGSSLPQTPPAPAPDLRKGFTQAALDHAEAMLDALGYTGKDVWTKTLAYQTDHGLDPDGLPGPATTASLEDTMSTLPDQVAAAVWGQLLARPGESDPTVRADTLLRYAANRAQAQAALDLLTQLASREGVDPQAVGRAIADSLREDVVAAVREAGSLADPEAVVDALAARLTPTPETTEEQS